MSIQAIVFDFGNVVGFFDHRRATRRLAAETGLTEDFLYRHLLDPALEDDYESGRLTSAEFLRHVRAQCGYAVPDELVADAFGDIFWANEEVCALIPRLKRRYRLLLGSNTTELHARRFRRQFADTLDHLHALVLSFEVGARKPQAAFFEHCQRLAGCAPQECLFIDDLSANIAGARCCGWHGILYQQPGNLHGRLAEFGVVLD